MAFKDVKPILYKRLKNGLYDPVLDDTELVYVPITQDEWLANNEQTCNVSNENENAQRRLDANETKSDKTQAKQTLDATFEDQIRLNIKDAFSQTFVEDLPPNARFKLPISDEYDPEGKKMSKLRRLYEKVLKIDLRKVLEEIRHEEAKNVREFKEVRPEVVDKDIGGVNLVNQNEMTKEVTYTDKSKKEFSTIKETAAKIVEKSINKALSVTEKKQKPKIEIEKKESKTESKVHKESMYENITSIKESKVEKLEKNTNFIKDVRTEDKKQSDKKERKRVTFDETAHKGEISFSKETENIELNTESDTRLTTERRKLLTQQEIEELIEPGTVRDRSEIFKKYNILDDVRKKSDFMHEKSDIKGREQILSKRRAKKLAQQRVYKIGAQTVLNIQRATYPSYSKVLLKTFFSKFTKVMITLSKFMKSKPNSYFKQEEELYYEKMKEERDYSKYINEGGLIIKNKLSGAKIAQIEGMKPVELTDKMNIVILELQRKSGIEEEFDKKEFKETEFDSTDFDKTTFYQTEFDEKEFYTRDRPGSRNKMDGEFEDASYQRNTNFDKQRKYETYETTKTQSMEIREMKSEKRYSEYKTTKKESSPCHEMQTYVRDADGNIIYIAIVEAHVYTNKDAIFEEHLRRLSETKTIEKIEMNKSDTTETTDKIDVYVAYDDSRKLSLASTTMIPVEEYSTVNEYKEKPVKYIRTATDMEHLAKRIAVQNITQVIEPLLKMEVNKFASSKYAHTEIEIPTKTIAEKTDISTEEKQIYFQAQVFVTQKSYMPVEKPDIPAVEITEISVDEDESGILEELKVEEKKPKPIVEIPVKSIAETSEVLISEDQIVDIVIPEPKIIEPSPTVDVTAKSVAITSEIIADEANIEVLDVAKATTKTSSAALEKISMAVAETIITSPEISSEALNVAVKARRESATIDVTKNIATEVLQVSFQEPMNEELKITETKRRQSQSFVEESFLTIPETITTFIEEPKNVYKSGLLEELKLEEEKPKAIIEIPVKSIAETSEVLINEDQIVEIIIPEPKIIEPSPTVDVTAKSVAITSEVIANEASVEVFDVAKAITKTSTALLEKTSMGVAETITTSPEISSEVLNAVAEMRKESATIDVGRNIATEILQVSFQEPMNEEIKLTETKRRQSQSFVEESFLTIPETITTFIEEPKHEELIVQKPQIEKANIHINTAVAAEVLEISFAEKEQKPFDVPKLIDMKSETSLETKKFVAAEVSVVYPLEPEHQDLAIEDVTEKQSRTLVEETNLTIAETLAILSEETSNEILELPKTSDQQAIVNIEELKAAEIITVSTAEPLCENLEIPKVSEKVPQISVESCVLTVPEALAVLPEGPKDEYFEIPDVPMKQTKSLIETPLLTIAESLDTLPEGPKEGGFEITEIPKEQPNIDLDGFKPLTTSIVFYEDQHKELEIPKIDDKHPQTVMESPVLTLAVSLAVLPGGPKDGTFEIDKITNAEPKVDFEDFKATVVNIVSPEGPKEEELKIPKVNHKLPQSEIETPRHALAEILKVTPEGPKEGDLDIKKTSEEKIKVNFNELHSVETTNISPGESIKENLPLPKIIKKEPQVKIQETKLNVAETVFVIPEEPKDQAFDVPKIKNQEARINVQELKAAETKVIGFEEIASEKLILPEVVKKQSQSSVVSSHLAVAEISTTSSVESATEVDEARLVEKALQKVNVTLETVTPVAHTTITSIEETHDLSAKLKSSTQTANVALVESTAAMIAETTAVTVAKEETFKSFDKDSKVKVTEIPFRIAQKAESEDIELNYTVELPKEHDDEVNEVFAEVTLTKQKSPPVEVFAEYEFNEKKLEVDSDIFECIKLLRKHEYTHGSMDASYNYTALISDVEIDKKVEEEILQILKSSKIEAEYVKSGDISYFTFPSPTLIPIIQEYMFRLIGPSLRRFQYMGDVFEEATLKLKSKLQKSTVQNFDANLTLILQDIALSQLQSEVIDVDMESVEYVSEKEVSSEQYFDSKKMSRSVEASVQSSEVQSLHTGVAIASAATKQTIETGIDVSVLAIEQEPIVESRKMTAHKKKKSKRSSAVAAESLQVESKSAEIQMLDASHSEAFVSEASLHAESLNANMEMSMQQNLSSMEMSQMQQSEMEMSSAEMTSIRKHKKSKKASALSLEANYVDQESMRSLESSMSMSGSAKKLALKTDLTIDQTSGAIENGILMSPPLSPIISPPLTPPTPLTDEYVFKLEIPLPHITRYVPRDCSYSPESSEEDIILKCGFIPHIITRIERIIYCPPLPTPPVSPERQIIPIYRKPVLKGGSDESRIISASLFKFFC